MRFLLLWALYCPFILGAQSPYFQQKVDYTIVCALDDVNHTLKGDIAIRYTNNAPEALQEIWMHLWGNAFKNRKSGFCKQKLANADTKFYFSEPKQLGEYRELNFTVNAQTVNWRYDPSNPDIAVLQLSTPLKPGETITISTPFTLKIPASFSRLGHVETSYQMTQWYPKPAVYDHKGWHAMPYLDQGEFFSEFGNFDVTITLPDNYVVGATGTLQTASERRFLETKAEETAKIVASLTAQKKDAYPASSANTKTIRYTAEQVHDFAWFADKRFLVLRDTATLESGKTVECWAMFPNEEGHLWQKGAFYVRRAVEFYSQHVGEYPWPHATAVHSALSAGGGMEYPMITVIGNSSSAEGLDEVITHEVGHNWFYGILASNERDHPFLDEGFNSYYEYRYMRTYYNGADPLGLPKFIFNPKRNGQAFVVAQLLLARERVNTPPDLHSNRMTSLAYGIQAYTKTGTTLRWLEQSIGTARFDRAMKAYYEAWKFKHPYPEDLRRAWTQVGLKDEEINWFFEQMQTQKLADPALTSVKKTSDGWALTVKQKGDSKVPFSVTGLKKGQPIETRWFAPEQPVTFPASVEADAFMIDYDGVTSDLNTRNNYIKTRKSLFRPIKIGSFLPIEERTKAKLCVMPWIGWNNTDKSMMGLLFFNTPFPSKRLQYYIAPGFSLVNKARTYPEKPNLSKENELERRLVGVADVRVKFFPGGFVPKLTIGASAKRFDYEYNPRGDYYLKMNRVVPQIRLELRDNSISFRHYINLRTIFLFREDNLTDSTGVFDGKVWKRNTIHELRYEAFQKKAPNPWQFSWVLEQQAYDNVFNNRVDYVRTTATWRQQFFYSRKNKVTARIFGGYFLKNTVRNRALEENALTLNPQGFNDYKFDQTFLARTGGAGILGRQVMQSDGGFKGAFGAAYANVLGNSNNFVLALNLKADLPKRLPLGLPIKPYFDLGYFDDATQLGVGRPRNEQLLWSGGLMLDFFKGGLEIYFPLASAKPLRNLYCEQGSGTNASAPFCGGNYLRMISWSVRVPFKTPDEVLEWFIR